MGTLIPARLRDALRELASALERIPAPPLDDAAEAALLPRFLQDHCFIAPGELVKFSTFKNCFLAFADEHGSHRWNQTRIIRSLPAPIVYGPFRSNQRYLGNVTLDCPRNPNSEPVVVRFGRLVVPKRSRASNQGVLRADRVARHLRKNGFAATEIAAHLARKGVVTLDDQPLEAEAVDSLIGDAESENVAAVVRQLVSSLNTLTKKGS